MLIRATGVTAAICLGAMVSATPSLAVPITYNLTMTQTSGNLVPNNSVAGTGSFTIEGPVGAGVVKFSEVTGGGLLALSFVINNRTFDLADTPPNTQFPATVSFLNGNLFTF